jgi:uncharacterized membrane protein YccC
MTVSSQALVRPVVTTSPLGWLTDVVRRHDADGTARRRALRAALVIPFVLAAALVTTNSEAFASSVLIGSLAHLYYGDYGGPIRERVTAYVATTTIGAVLIVFGTTVAGQVPLVVVLTFVVGFTVTVAGALGTLAVHLRTPLMMAFLLSAASAGDAWVRLVGWSAAGAVALLAALVILPRRDETLVGDLAAAACDDLAASLVAGAPGPPPPSVAAFRAAQESGRVTAHGPTSRSRALLVLVEEIERFESMLVDLPRPRGDHRPSADADRPDSIESSLRASADAQLVDGIASVLRASAAALRDDGPGPDITALEAARAGHRRAFDSWAERELASGRPADQVLDALDAQRPLYLLSHVVLTIADAAAIASGRPTPSRWTPAVPRDSVGWHPVDVVRRVWRTIDGYELLSSVRFRDSLRAGVAFGLAILIATAGDFEHVSWVVLGSVAVLRTSVLADSHKAVQVVGGTALGFVPVLPLLWLTAFSETAQWFALHPSLLLAAFAVGALPYAIGQAAFTVFYVMAINMIEHGSWRTAEVRLEDVAIGAAVATVIGLLIWPSGARRPVRRALADLYRNVADHLGLVFAVALGPGLSAPPLFAAEKAYAEAWARASTAVDNLIEEEGRTTRRVHASASLLAGATTVYAESPDIPVLPRYADSPTCSTSVMVDDARAVVRGYRLVADGITSDATVGGPDPEQVRADRHRATTACLAAWGGRPDPSQRAVALTLVWAGHSIVDMAELAQRLRASAATLAG